MSYLNVNINNYNLNNNATNFLKNQIFLIIIQTLNYHNFRGIPPFFYIFPKLNKIEKY